MHSMHFNRILIEFLTFLGKKRAAIMSAHCWTAKQNTALKYFWSWRLSEHSDLRIKWCSFSWSQAHKLRRCSLSFSCVCVFTENTWAKEKAIQTSHSWSLSWSRGIKLQGHMVKNLRPALLLNAVQYKLTKKGATLLAGLAAL